MNIKTRQPSRQVQGASDNDSDIPLPPPNPRSKAKTRKIIPPAPDTEDDDDDIPPPPPRTVKKALAVARRDGSELDDTSGDKKVVSIPSRKVQKAPEVDMESSGSDQDNDAGHSDDEEQEYPTLEIDSDDLASEVS